jgi:hypothetical protein
MTGLMYVIAKKYVHYCSFILVIFTFSSISLATSDTDPKPLVGKTSEVHINNRNGHYQLIVNGKPFYVKGAGLEFGNQEQLAFYGGNSFRTWQTDNGQESGNRVLDRALQNGLFVTFGIDMASERSGFNYDDPNAVAIQLQRIKSEVIEYKNHPALLMWAVGNELNLGSTNPKVWDAVNQVAQMIHQLDPNHPVMTTLAGFDSELIDLLKSRAYSLDLIGIQLYADIANLQDKLRASNWQGAYIVTEWGSTGHWEVPLTNWGAPIEDNSSQKATALAKRYINYIQSDKQQCLGSYVFLWGQKQERTPTWYSLFLESGEATEAVDVMSHLWTGKWPVNRSPSILTLKINSLVAENNVRLDAGQMYSASISAQDADQDVLTFRWQIMSESDAKSIGGDYENVPSVITSNIHDLGNGRIQFNTPTSTGNFRLFVYVYDGKGNAAHANIPFQVAAFSD